jgi:hypothetical protein
MTESDAAAARLYSILGLTEADIKILADDATTRSFRRNPSEKQSDGKSMCAVDPMLANMTPEQVEEKYGAQRVD